MQHSTNLFMNIKQQVNAHAKNRWMLRLPQDTQAMLSM